MKTFPLFSFIGLLMASLAQADLVQGFPESPAKEIRSSAEPPIEASKCPQPSTISPCTCSKWQIGVEFECSGSGVNQTTIETAFRKLRLVNEIPADRGFDIFSLLLNQTALTQLDLAPFYGSRIRDLNIEENSNLTKFVTSGNSGDHESIWVLYLSLEKSPLNRQGFGDTLKYFSKEMYSFSAAHLDLNNLNNPDFEESEFLPGLSAFTDLGRLALQQCNISGRLDFDTLIPKELKNLDGVDLSNNSINGIGENVFGLEGGPEGSLEILLDGNKLNETSFHPNSGIARADRVTYLYLSYNQLTTLPTPIFETFLDANQRNSLYLSGNPLICDCRLRWLKSRREDFQQRVEGADCSNDPGHTVFDSDLIL